LTWRIALDLSESTKPFFVFNSLAAEHERCIPPKCPAFGTHFVGKKCLRFNPLDALFNSAFNEEESELLSVDAYLRRQSWLK